MRHGMMNANARSDGLVVANALALGAAGRAEQVKHLKPQIGHNIGFQAPAST